MSDKARVCIVIAAIFLSICLLFLWAFFDCVLNHSYPTFVARPNFCSRCGAQLRTMCPGCSRAYSSPPAFCSDCGYSFESPENPAPDQEAAE